MRNKQERFRQIAERYNVICPEKPYYLQMSGKWRKIHFKNNHPLVVELACGRGEYTVGLSKVFPNKNFVGVDIKGDRIWKGSNQAIEESLHNAAFLRTHILYLERFFDEKEISEIWITFPDPRPKKRDTKRRLTSDRFLDIYKCVLADDGWIHLKTDNTPLFEFTLDLIQKRPDIINISATADLYNSEFSDHHHGIKTRFEKIFTAKGEVIKYLKFQIK